MKIKREQSVLPIKVDLQEEIPFNLGILLPSGEKPKKRINRIRGDFPCPQCDRHYIRKDSLQRHLTYECGKEPMFQCPFCPQKCKRKGHQIRHVRRRHKDKIGLLEENNPGLFIKTIKNDVKEYPLVDKSVESPLDTPLNSTKLTDSTKIESDDIV